MSRVALKHSRESVDTPPQMLSPRAPSTRLEAPVTDGPYAGASLTIGRRLSGGVAVIGAVLELALLAFAAPTHVVGTAGWAIAGALAAILAVAGGLLMRRDSTASPAMVAAVQWAGLASVGVLTFLTGGAGSPESPVTLLWMVCFATFHPWRRAVPFLLVASLMTVAPLVYDHASPAEVGDVLGQLVTWLVMAAVANRWQFQIRRDRLERERAEQRATTLARVDSLTGLGNRRAFDEALTSLVARAHVDGSPLSVVVADLDDFKDINDRFGHGAGDRCLQDVAEALYRILRGSDRAYRWGGDEFAIVLPGASRREAEAVCDRITEAVAVGCADPDGARLELGCGSAQLEPLMGAEALLDAADLDLMAGKGTRGARRFRLLDAREA
jgi:diguanylate cyclase (GGDEF)-like protein